MDGKTKDDEFLLRERISITVHQGLDPELFAVLKSAPRGGLSDLILRLASLGSMLRRSGVYPAGVYTAQLGVVSEPIRPPPTEAQRLPVASNASGAAGVVEQRAEAKPDFSVAAKLDFGAFRRSSRNKARPQN